MDRDIDFADEPVGAWAEADDAEVEAATRRVIDRLIALSAELDADERSVLTRLLAPALGPTADEDVTGFDLGGPRLPAGVVSGIRATGFRVRDRDPG